MLSDQCEGREATRDTDLAENVLSLTRVQLIKALRTTNTERRKKPGLVTRIKLCQHTRLLLSESLLLLAKLMLLAELLLMTA